MRSNPLDVFVTSEEERRILEIFISMVAKMSHRKRKHGYEYAITRCRTEIELGLPNILAAALTSIEHMKKEKTGEPTDN